MNIVIIAGGTGSIALQSGMNNLVSGFEGTDIKILVNAYDNGLSTGAVRKVLGGKILGPSDVRKNQTTLLKLQNKNSPWNDFLDIRFTIESSKARQYCLDEVDNLKAQLEIFEASVKPILRKETNTTLVKEAIDKFFQIPIALKIDYTDFSLANIIYAGFAAANENSLRKTATIISQLIGIKDNVILNDDTSLFLGAITKSGKHITDESDIVSWGNTEDPFVDVFFTDVNGQETKPTLCDEAVNALKEADLIILSSGTQWSSLIPTYESVGFKETIESSNAKIIMVMNKWPDKDSPGQTPSDIIDILVPKYFPIGRLELILDTTGHVQMRTVSQPILKKISDVHLHNLGTSDLSLTKHDALKLAYAVGLAYFKDYLYSDYFMFDYDDTLVGRGNLYPKSSHYNSISLNMLKYDLNVSVCTGNSIKALNLKIDKGFGATINFTYPNKPLDVFADGGVNKYAYDCFKPALNDHSDDGIQTTLVECIDTSVKINPDGEFGSIAIIEKLRNAGISISKIENRGDVMLSIKPIDPEYRQSILNLVSLILKNSGLVVKSAGRTTIEICKPGLSKTQAVKYILAEANGKNITYVGDELDSGNDYPVANLSTLHNNLKCLKVKSPTDTAFFLKVLEITCEKNVNN